MKKIYALILTVLCVAYTYAQTDGINYQAVIINPNAQEIPGNDAAGNILPNRPVSLRFTVINTNRSNDYSEIQRTTTDAFGLVNVIIGHGESIENSFTDIDWDGTPKQLLVEIDVSNNGNFVSLDEQELTFLPYALHRNITATGNLDVDGQTIFNDDFTVNGITQLNGTLNTLGEATLNNSLNVEGVTTLNNDVEINGNSQLNGTLRTTGNVNVESNLNIDGITTLNSNVEVNANATVNGDLEVTDNFETTSLTVSSDGDIMGRHVALFENTSGSQDADGIAIKLDTGTLSIDNHFVSFYGADDQLAGRIESYDFFGGDLLESFPVPDFSTLFNIFDFSENPFQGGSLPSLSVTGGSLPSASFRRGSLPGFRDDGSFSAGSLPSLSFRAGSFPDFNFTEGSFPSFNLDGFFNPDAGQEAMNEIRPVVAWGLRNGYPGFIPSSHWQIALAALIISANQFARDQGVVYGSKGADYAEYLEKENPDDTFIFGEVVGVKGGKITKNTTDADRVMTISLNPIVLGNMPEAGKEHQYEKVGFMGQVPALVAGKVKVGDFVLASGNNDGYGIAKSVEDIEISDLKNIIGRAWSESDPSGLSIINVSVGLKTNEWITIFEKQQRELDNIKQQLEELETLSETVKRLENKLIYNTAINQ